jgi:phage shock protein C
MTCAVCGSSMDDRARFCSACGHAFVAAAPPPPSPFAVPKGLVRPREGRMIAGVCAGIAQHLGWDVTLVRIVLVVMVFFGCGTGLLAYLIGWIVMPNAPYGMPAQTGVARQ